MDSGYKPDQLANIPSHLRGLASWILDEFVDKVRRDLEAGVDQHDVGGGAHTAAPVRTGNLVRVITLSRISGKCIAFRSYSSRDEAEAVARRLREELGLNAHVEPQLRRAAHVVD